ncbi:GNAT family N-acetyltransferase [Neobacillus mesonae]|nr:GNAT family N-acetyltransferase [Neobacillus mesonae]
MEQNGCSFQAVGMSEEHAAEISTWQYDPPYNIYGWLPWDQMKALGIEFGDPELRAAQYISVLNNENELCGFAQLFPLTGVTRIGLGMKPELCGHGLGASFVQSIVKEAVSRNAQNEIDLEVLTWNRRAIRTYEKAGFVIHDTYERLTPEGLKPFFCMVYTDAPFE